MASGPRRCRRRPASLPRRVRRWTRRLATAGARRSATPDHGARVGVEGVGVLTSSCGARRSRLDRRRRGRRAHGPRPPSGVAPASSTSTWRSSVPRTTVSVSPPFAGRGVKRSMQGVDPVDRLAGGGDDQVAALRSLREPPGSRPRRRAPAGRLAPAGRPPAASGAPRAPGQPPRRGTGARTPRRAPSRSTAWRSPEPGPSATISPPSSRRALTPSRRPSASSRGPPAEPRGRVAVCSRAPETRRPRGPRKPRSAAATKPRLARSAAPAGVGQGDHGGADPDLGVGRRPGERLDLARVDLQQRHAEVAVDPDELRARAAVLGEGHGDPLGADVVSRGQHAVAGDHRSRPEPPAAPDPDHGGAALAGDLGDLRLNLVDHAQGNASSSYLQLASDYAQTAYHPVHARQAANPRALRAPEPTASRRPPASSPSRSRLPGPGRGAGRGRRSLDALDRRRPAVGRQAVRGAAERARRDRAERPLEPPAAAHRAAPGGRRAVLAATGALRLRAHRGRARAGRPAAVAHPVGRAPDRRRHRRPRRVRLLRSRRSGTAPPARSRLPTTRPASSTTPEWRACARVGDRPHLGRRHRGQPLGLAAAWRGFSIGVRTASICSRRPSSHGGNTSVSPRCSGSSSAAKPGLNVAISNSTPLGSRK